MKGKTFLCSFDEEGPRISAYEIHERISNTLNLQEEEVSRVQVEGPKRQA
jgi:hypothetical protein